MGIWNLPIVYSEITQCWGKWMLLSSAVRVGRNLHGWVRYKQLISIAKLEH
jgi:hypothetical protein